MSPTGPPRSENILVRAVNWVGDAVMTLPALAALRRARPEARITVLVRPRVADIYEASGLADELMFYVKPGRHQGFSGMWRLAREIRQKRFDRAVLFQNAFEAAALVWLARVPFRAGYNTDARSFLLNQSIKLGDNIKVKHQVYYYLNLIEGLGLEASFSEPRLKLRDEEYQAARDFLSEKLDLSGPLIGLAPGAAYGPAKCWFPERFAQTADRLIGDHQAGVVIFGGPDEARTAAEVAGLIESPRVLNLAGQTTLKQALALIGVCDLFLTNDSGLMHVAAAQEVPMVAVFGSTNPLTTGPRGDKSVIVRHAPECSPCLEPVCPTDYECLRAVEVDEVVQACERLLGGARGG
ncbi:MAG: lipopolysaccharide heptosyltransferase II [Proteobacteria bacterium]|nr:lipopolysaccharide heptosyltransferase II [Pseudomonadota bacterium]